MMNDPLSRKVFLKNTALALAGIPLGLSTLKASGHPEHITPPSAADKLSISIFSKHLHWLGYAEMAALAASLGYEGIDLTVRSGGHVEPEQVATRLPEAVKIIREAGLEVYTITTDIRSAGEVHTEAILKATASLGIKNYRMGWYSYSGKGIMADLERFKSDLAGLAALNEKYHIHGDYENHTGRFAGPIWDLWMCLKDLDPKWIGCQFDIRHATVDGAEAWPGNLELIRPYLGSITVKDFHWEKKAAKWGMQNVPLGEGMVDFPRYFKLLKQFNFQKPISHHFEYPLGGAESGAKKLSIPKDEVITHIRTDLQLLKSWLKQYEL